MIRKSEYTIADILASKRKVLTTRFYVSPDRHAETKAKLGKLGMMYPYMLIAEIPLFYGLDEFIESSTREYYSPSKISMDVATIAPTLNRDWAKDKVIAVYRNRINSLNTSCECLASDNGTYLTHIEINNSKINDVKQSVEKLEAEKSMRSDRAVGIDKQIEEINLDGVWQVFELTDRRMSLVTKYPMVLADTETGNMLQTGKWLLRINYFDGPAGIRLIPFQSSINADNYSHPNVSSNNPCLGENFEKIEELLELFRILDVTRFFTGFLTSYTHHNPYIRFNRMFEIGRVYHPSYVNVSALDNSYATFIDVAKVLENPTSYSPLLVRLVYMLDMDKEMKVPEGYRPTQLYKELYPDDFEPMVDEEEPEDEEVEDETDWHTVETSNEEEEAS